MAREIRIEQEARADRGRYIARIDGIDGEAELTYTVLGPSLISADHTLAPDSMRGSGAAAALVNRLIADARGAGLKIMPLCSYVRAQFEKHPEWRDIMSDAA